MSTSGESEPNDDAGQSAKAAAILGGIFALAALGLYGTRAAFSVLVGAAVAIANLLAMRAIIRALVRVSSQPDDAKDAKDAKDAVPDDRAEDPTTGGGREETGGQAGIAWGVLAAFKMLILFGGLWFLLTRRIVDPMALLVGYGVLPLGIAASAVWSSLRSRY